jgi:Flp pilus assembly pilin Flp
MMVRFATQALLPVVARLRERSQAERGQTLGEYSLILALIAVGVTTVGLIAFRTVLAAGFDDFTSCLLDGC